MPKCDPPQSLVDHYLIFNAAGPEGLTLPGKAKPLCLSTADNGTKAHCAVQDQYFPNMVVFFPRELHGKPSHVLRSRPTVLSLSQGLLSTGY